MKKIFLSILFVFINLFALEKEQNVSVNPLVFSAVDVLHIRQKADINSHVIGFYANREAIEVITQNNNWIKTPDGYIPSNLVFTIKAKNFTAPKNIITVTKDKLFLRERPSITEKIKGFLTKGQKIASLEQIGNWIKTPYGYILSKDTSKKDSKTKQSFTEKKPSTSSQDPVIEFSQKAYEQLEKNKIRKLKFDFETYLSKLLYTDKNYDNSYLNLKLARLKNLILQDKYNFDFYFLATLGHNRDISDNGDFTRKSSFSSELVLTKRLYDGQKSYTYNKKAFLEQRLSELEHLKVKEQIILLGLDIYTNLLTVQEQIKIQRKVQKYKQSLLNNLNKRTKVLKVVDLDKLAIQNEILDLEKNIIVLTQTYKTYNHIFRQSIDLRAKGKLVLGWFDISKPITSLYDLKKIAMAKNSDIAISQDKLKLLQAEIVMEHSRQDWEIDFNSRIGQKKVKTKTNNTEYNTNGAAWDSSLTFKYPIYERDDINLNVQRAKLETLRAKNDLNMQQKNILNLIEQKYNEYEQANKLDTILKKQSKILTHTKEAYKKRYLLGAGTYREFSEELTKHLDNENDILLNSINTRKSFIELSLLIGDKIFGK